MSAVSIQPLCAINAFESQLKTLCVKEFPCGLGNWRENHKKGKKVIEKNKVISQFSITLKDYGAVHEKTETLSELLSAKRSPWNLDYSWSDEAKRLREIAVKSPWLIDNNFIFSHFVTLRLIDRQITVLDEEFLKFSNLEELTLSANYLKTVDSRNFPPNLKVLELCGNQISQMEDLCKQSPPLQHLGLGHNALTSVEDYITSQYWPCLLSLDLSHNHLVDLMDIIRKLQSLPKLRNLILLGNPLAMQPGYRGYTIDSIRNLDFLDDISISADEKHIYKGLARKKEFILDEAKFVFRVEYIRGVPQPEELKHPEDQPEFPVVSRKYFVQFMFLEGRQSNTEILNMFDNDNHAPRCESKNQEEDGVPVTSEGSRHNLNSAPTMTVRSSTKAPSLTELSPGPQNEFSDDAVELNELPTWEEPVLVAFDSVKSTWEENIELSWVKVQTRDNLLAVRNFLKNGIDLAVMEEKVLSFPAEPAPGEERMESPSGKKGKDTKVKKDDKKPKSGKQNEKTKQKETKKPDDGKKKGKKKEPEVAMTSMPAEYVVLAKFHLPLADLLDGETKVEAILTKSASEIGGRESPQISETESKKMEKKEKKKAGDKGKGQDKDKKGKGSKVPAETNTEDEEAAPPVPLELQVSLRLHHWATARDCGQTIEGEDDGAEEEKSLVPPSKGK